MNRSCIHDDKINRPFPSQVVKKKIKKLKKINNDNNLNVTMITVVRNSVANSLIRPDGFFFCWFVWSCVWLQLIDGCFCVIDQRPVKWFLWFYESRAVNWGVSDNPAAGRLSGSVYTSAPFSRLRNTHTHTRVRNWNGTEWNESKCNEMYTILGSQRVLHPLDVCENDESIAARKRTDNGWMDGWIWR